VGRWLSSEYSHGLGEFAFTWGRSRGLLVVSIYMLTKILLTSAAMPLYRSGYLGMPLVAFALGAWLAVLEFSRSGGTAAYMGLCLVTPLFSWTAHRPAERCCDGNDPSLS